MAPAMPSMFSLILVISSPSSQKVDMDAIEDVGVLELRPVTALIHHYETRAGNHVCDLLAFVGCRGRVVRRPDDHRRRLDRSVLLRSDHVGPPDFHLL